MAEKTLADVGFLISLLHNEHFLLNYNSCIEYRPAKYRNGLSTEYRVSKSKLLVQHTSLINTQQNPKSNVKRRSVCATVVDTFL